MLRRSCSSGPTLRSGRSSADRRGGTTLLGVALLLAACASPSLTPTPASFFFPRHEGRFGEGDAALLIGTPAFVSGCLVVVADDGSVVLPIWPADARLGMIDGEPAVLSPSGELLVETGDAFAARVELAGSETTLDRAAELAGDVPDRCGADRAWVVSDVVGRP